MKTRCESLAFCAATVRERSTVETEMQTIRIATYNIHKGRGLDSRTRVERIARVLEKVDADIIALQGTQIESD